jgi:hypothetical protein
MAVARRRSDSNGEVVGLPTAACLWEIGPIFHLGLSTVNLGS